MPYYVNPHVPLEQTQPDGSVRVAPYIMMKRNVGGRMRIEVHVHPTRLELFKRAVAEGGHVWEPLLSAHALKQALELARNERAAHRRAGLELEIGGEGG